MPVIKDAAAIAEKWARVTPQRTQDYTNGVTNPGTDWAQATAGAESNYKDGVQKAITRNSFSKGVRAAGTQKWQEAAIRKGPARFAEGVSQAEDTYSTGFAPFQQVISSTTLPPRFPKGDTRNIERVRVMAEALRKKKESL